MSKSKWKIMSLPISVVLLLMLAGAVSAGTCTFVTPGAAATISGTSYTFNISVSTDLIQNCSITGSSALSGDTWTVGTALNDSGINNSNVTVSSAGEYDAADWVFSATCVNSSGATVDTCTRSAIKVNNTIPVVTGCTIDGATAASTDLGSSTFTYLCTVKNATSCTVYWQGSSHAMATDSSSSVCTFTGTSSYASAGTTATCSLMDADDENTAVYMTCTDGLDSTSSTSYNVKTEGDLGGMSGTDDNKGLVNVVTQNLGNKRTVFYLLLAAVAMFLFLLMAFSGKKK